MSHLRTVFQFGWPYLRRYWRRFACGVLLGVVFGVSNAAFLWATNTLIKRMSPAPAIELAPKQSDTPVTAVPPQQTPGGLKEKFEQGAQAVVDPWLPALGRTPDWRQILGGLLLFPALAAVRGFIGYLSSYCLAWSSERVVNDLRVDVLKKVTTLSLDFFNRSTMGDLITRVNGDTAMLQRCLNLGLSDLVKEPVTVAAILSGLCLLDWQLTLGAMIFYPLCIVPVIVLGRKIRRASRQGVSTNITQASLLVEMLSGIRVIKAFGLEEAQVARFRQLSTELIRYTMKGVRAKEKINPAIEIIAMLGFGLLVLFIAWQQRSFAHMATFLIGMAFIYTPIKKLATLHVLFQQTAVGVERLAHILQEQPTVREHPQARALAGFNSAIEFDNVNFSYGNQPVLQNINLEIPRGLKLGVAGESGSGKSTLVNLLFRFYDPTRGGLKVDGVDVREVSLRDLRQLMALVSQEIVIFDQSVAENIASGKAGATAPEIEAAARAAHAHEFISRLPHGYETLVGERGVTLSGGERQRLALARAFIRNAPILVLDEATASLDSQSEAEVQQAIDELAERRTVISVAHRLSTLARMDRIIVLSQGRLIEQGSFGELLRAGGVFADMARRQGIK